MKNRILTLVTIALLATGCASANLVSVTPVPATPASADTAKATQAAPQSQPPAAKTAAPTQFVPTPAPTAAGPDVAAIGDTVLLTWQNDDPWGEVTVSNVTQATKFVGRSWTDKADPGYIFITAKITYKNIGTKEISYNLFDWIVSTDGDQSDPACTAVSFGCVGSVVPSIYAPQPELSSGKLSPGKSVSGFITWEVPAKGEVRIGYEGQNGVIYEVILRAS